MFNIIFYKERLYQNSQISINKKRKRLKNVTIFYITQNLVFLPHSPFLAGTDFEYLTTTAAVNYKEILCSYDVLISTISTFRKLKGESELRSFSTVICLAHSTDIHMSYGNFMYDIPKKNDIFITLVRNACKILQELYFYIH